MGVKIRHLRGPLTKREEIFVICKFLNIFILSFCLFFHTLLLNSPPPLFLLSNPEEQDTFIFQHWSLKLSAPFFQYIPFILIMPLRPFTLINNFFFLSSLSSLKATIIFFLWFLRFSRQLTDNLLSLFNLLTTSGI